MNMLNGEINAHWVPGMTLDSIEKASIFAALKFYRGNVAQTALALGVSDKTIRNKVEKYESDEKLRADQDALYRIEQGRILDRMRGINVSPGQTTGVPPNEQKRFETSTGVHIQPSPPTPPKHEMSMPKRDEVQSVLPKHAAGGGHHKRR